MVDQAGRLVGLVPPPEVLAVLAAEHDEDLARLSGFTHDLAAARHASVESTGRRFRHRLPWLLLGLGRDPPYGSGPLATVVQDLLSVLIYMVIAGGLAR